MISTFRNRLRVLKRDQKGAAAVEYGLILAVIVLAAMVAIVFMGDRVIAMWSYIQTQVEANG